MARRSARSDDPIGLATQIAKDLTHYGDQVSHRSVRDNVQTLIPISDQLRDLGASLIEGAGGKARMLAYFRASVASPIPSRELETIAGIGEWARRIRELRVEQGWPIFSADTLAQISEDDPEQAADIEKQVGFSISSMEEESYILLADAQDARAAETWLLLKSIAQKKISVKNRILEFFRANVGYPVSGERLRYLARGKTEWARRTRELRTEDGWPVLTRMQGRPDLPVGVYVLAEDRQAEPHDRKISDFVRSEVMRRDGFACRHCGWPKVPGHPDERKHFLELHHIVGHVRGGKNTADNLVTLCNVDHDAVHRRELALPSDWP